jgi:hypothetical protein
MAAAARFTAEYLWCGGGQQLAVELAWFSLMMAIVLPRVAAVRVVPFSGYPPSGLA